jgi:hypothetical protein
MRAPHLVSLVALILGIVSLNNAASADRAGMQIAKSMREHRVVQRVDGRYELHCHNFPRRTKCHKTERLPELWLATKPASQRGGTSNLSGSAQPETRRIRRCLCE